MSNRRTELLDLAAQMEAEYPNAFTEAVELVLSSPFLISLSGGQTPDADSEEVRVLAAETVKLDMGVGAQRPEWLNGIAF